MNIVLIGYYTTTWNNTKKDKFTESLDVNLIEQLYKTLEDYQSNLSCVDGKIIDDMSVNIVNMFLSAADDAGCVHRKVNQTTKAYVNNVNKWFNNKCANMRKRYNRAKVRYKKNNSETNLTEMNACGNEYKKTIRKAKYNYNKKFISNLRNVKKCNSKEYWKLLSEKSHHTIQADFDDLTQHFKELNKPSNQDHDFTDLVNNTDNDYINSNFTTEEVKKGIKKLK